MRMVLLCAEQKGRAKLFLMQLYIGVTTRAVQKSKVDEGTRPVATGSLYFNRLM